MGGVPRWDHEKFKYLRLGVPPGLSLHHPSLAVHVRGDWLSRDSPRKGYLIYLLHHLSLLTNFHSAKVFLALTSGMVLPYFSGRLD